VARHATSVDSRARATRIVAIAVVWFAGLWAGFFGILSAVAKYGCSGNDDGLACQTSGSMLGIVLVVVVIALVTTATVLMLGQPARRVVPVGAVGVVALIVCFVAARVLLDTV
jgi:hypothetical protein